MRRASTSTSIRSGLNLSRRSLRQLQQLPPAAAAAGSCRVLSWALNIRRGPGTQFVPDTALVRGAVLEPLERTVDGQWVRVRIPETGQVGWVSRGFIACTVDPGKLPVYVF